MAAKIKMLRSVWLSGKSYTFGVTYEVGKDVTKEDAELALRNEAAEMASAPAPPPETTADAEPGDDGNELETRGGGKNGESVPLGTADVPTVGGKKKK